MQPEINPFHKISYNGKILSIYDPVVPASDQGLMYGYGVFDTLRIYKKMPFMLDRHIERLLSAAYSINLNVKAYANNIHKWLNEFILELDVADCIVRVTVTKGCQEMPCVIITSRPLNYTQKQYENGFSACISSIRRNAHSPLATIKSLNFLDNILARQMANGAGFDEALMLNGNDFLCECSMSNLFFITNETIFTPKLDCGVLNGITRVLVIETIVPTMQMNLCERQFTTEDLKFADEAFLTNSAMGIMPLVSLDGHAIGEGKPGKITGYIMKRYVNLLNLEVRD